MGITRKSLYPYIQLKLKYHFKSQAKINYKKNLYKKRNNTSLLSYIENDLRITCEEELYNLVSKMAHVRKYIKNMIFEYCGEAAEEMKVYLTQINDLHATALQHYYASSKNERNLYMTHVDKYNCEFNTFMEDCGIDYTMVYEYLFDFPEESGYTTPQRPSTPVELVEQSEDIEIITTKIHNITHND